MAWSPSDLRRRICATVRSFGDWVLWEKGLPCACHAATSLRMIAACDRCHGDGFVWIEPTRIKALLSSIQGDRRLSSLGWIAPGDLTLSADPDHRLHDFDRVTLTSATQAEADVIVRGRDERIPELAPSEDALSYLAAKPIACVAHDGREFRFGEDYVLAGRVLRWIRPPPDGTVYVVKFEALLSFLAFASPLEVLDRGQNLGQRALLRKRHLVNLRDPQKRDVHALLGW